MRLLEQMALSILSFCCNVLNVLAWPLLFIGDLLSLPGKYFSDYTRQRKLELLAKEFGFSLTDGDALRRMLGGVETDKSAKDDEKAN